MASHQTLAHLASSSHFLQVNSGFPGLARYYHSLYNEQQSSHQLHASALSIKERKRTCGGCGSLFIPGVNALFKLKRINKNKSSSKHSNRQRQGAPTIIDLTGNTASQTSSTLQIKCLVCSICTLLPVFTDQKSKEFSNQCKSWQTERKDGNHTIKSTSGASPQNKDISRQSLPTKPDPAPPVKLPTISASTIIPSSTTTTASKKAAKKKNDLKSLLNKTKQNQDSNKSSGYKLQDFLNDL